MAENKKPRLDHSASSSSSMAQAVDNDDDGLDAVMELGQQFETLGKFEDFCTNYLLASLYPLDTDQVTGTPVNKVSFVIGTLTSLGMLIVGAKGKTRSSIACELGIFGLCRQDLDAALRELFNSLNSLPVYDAEFTLSSRLAINDKYHVLEDFIEATKNAGLPMHTVLSCEMDCKQERKDLEAKLKNWIAQLTNGGVSEIGLSLLPSTQMVLITAGLLSDTWGIQMTAGTSQFFREPGHPAVVVDTITASGTLSISELFSGEPYSCETIRIPMKCPNLELVLFNPTGREQIGETFKKVLIKRGLLDSIYDKSKDFRAEVTFPVLRETAENLVKTNLCKINLDKLFERGADFSGMVNSKDITLSHMIDIAKVTVDVKGVNISGNTSAKGRSMSKRQSAEAGQKCDEIKVVKIEAPFGFMLVAYKKITLFGGLIFNPEVTGVVPAE